MESKTDTESSKRISISGFLERDTVKKEPPTAPPSEPNLEATREPLEPVNQFSNGVKMVRDYPKGTHRFGLLRFLDSSIKACRPQEIVHKPDMVSRGEWFAVHATLFFNHAARLYFKVEEECENTVKACDKKMLGGGEAEYLWAGSSSAAPSSTPAHAYIMRLFEWLESYLNRSVPDKDFAEYPANFEKSFKVFIKRIFRLYAHLNYCHRNALPDLDPILMHFLFFIKHFKLMEKRELDVMRKRYDLYVDELGLKDDIHDLFAGKETEDNWQARDRCLHQLVDLSKTDPESTYMNMIRPSLEPILTQLLSARTQLSLSCALLIDILTKTSSSRTPEADDLLLPLLLKVASGTKKVVAQEAHCLLKQLVKTSRQPLRLLTILSIELYNNDKNQQIRVRGQEALLILFLENYKQVITDQKALKTITAILKKTIGDASPECRYAAAQCFWLLERESVETAAALYEELDGSARKQLSMALGKLERDHLAPVHHQRAVVVEDAGLESEPVRYTEPVQCTSVEISTAASEEDEEVIININGGTVDEAIMEPIESETVVPKQEPSAEPIVEPEQVSEQEITRIMADQTEPDCRDQTEPDYHNQQDDKEEQQDKGSDMEIDESAPQPDDIIPHFISMDIDMNAFEVNQDTIAEDINNDTDVPFSHQKHAVDPKNDTDPENVAHLQNLHSPRMTLRQRLGLATSTPYKATSTQSYTNTPTATTSAPLGFPKDTAFRLATGHYGLDRVPV